MSRPEAESSHSSAWGLPNSRQRTRAQGSHTLASSRRVLPIPDHRIHCRLHRRATPRRRRTVLKRLREERGWSMAKLAEEAGVKDAYIAQLETGSERTQHSAILKRLARAVGVPVTELLD